MTRRGESVTNRHSVSLCLSVCLSVCLSLSRHAFHWHSKPNPVLHFAHISRLVAQIWNRFKKNRFQIGSRGFCVVLTGRIGEWLTKWVSWFSLLLERLMIMWCLNNIWSCYLITVPVFMYGIVLGTNLIHDYTAVTFSVKLAIFLEKRPFPWSPWFFVNFNAITFIYEGFGSSRIVLPLKCEGHLTGINISVSDGIQTEPMQVTKKSCLGGVCKGAWIISSERLITSIYYCY